MLKSTCAKLCLKKMVEKLGSESAVKDLAPNVHLSKKNHDGSSMALLGAWSDLVKFQSLCISTLTRSEAKNWRILLSFTYILKYIPNLSFFRHGNVGFFHTIWNIENKIHYTQSNFNFGRYARETYSRLLQFALLITYPFFDVLDHNFATVKGDSKKIGECDYFPADSSHKCRIIIDVVVPSKSLLKTNRQSFSESLKSCFENSFEEACYLESSSVAFLEFPGFKQQIQTSSENLSTYAYAYFWGMVEITAGIFSQFLKEKISKASMGGISEIVFVFEIAENLENFKNELLSLAKTYIN